jgi:predicted transcriptional regulator
MPTLIPVILQIFTEEYIKHSGLLLAMLPTLEIIPDRRRKLGLTQSQLAGLACVSQSYIAKLEAGNIEPSYIKVKAIFEALDRLEQKKQVAAAFLMTRSVISVQKTATVQEAIGIMKQTGFSQLPILDGEMPVGAISEGNILDHMLTVKGETPARFISEIMDAPFPLVAEDAPVSLLTSLLKFYAAVLVQRKGVLVGIITKADLLGVIS